MVKFEELASAELIKSEYQKTFLLNIFQKICVRLEKDEKFKSHTRTLFRQTHNPSQTLCAIIGQELKYDLSNEEAEIMLPWLQANLKKDNQRKRIADETKRALYEKQKGRCMVCGEQLESWKGMHVDHIIPFSLVGDELDDNYQALCATCNLSKSARTDFVFKKLLQLI